MKKTTLLALAILAWPALNQAQPVAQPPAAPGSVADPAAPVPAMSYRSVLDTASKGIVQDTDDWQAANARVGQFPRGHADLLQWEAAQGASRAPDGAAPPPATSPPDMPMRHHQPMPGADTPAAPEAHPH